MSKFRIFTKKIHIEGLCLLIGWQKPVVIVNRKYITKIKHMIMSTILITHAEHATYGVIFTIL